VRLESGLDSLKALIGLVEASLQFVNPGGRLKAISAESQNGDDQSRDENGNPGFHI